MNQLKVSQLVKEYNNQVIIPNLSLEVGSNEVLSILGPSGCGKTTFIRMIAGLESPTSGKIEIGNEVVYDSSRKILTPPEKRHLGMVFQNYALWPHLTVLENVAFPLTCQRLSKSEIKTRTEEALTQVKLSGFEHRKPNQLSGGQQQRVGLARALASRPKILLLDEPLSNLDANLRDEMCEQLLQIKKSNPMTMLYVTHDQGEAFRLSDRIVILNQGHIEQIGTVAELKKAPSNEFVRSFLRL